MSFHYFLLCFRFLSLCLIFFHLCLYFLVFFFFFNVYRATVTLSLPLNCITLKRISEDRYFRLTINRIVWLNYLWLLKYTHFFIHSLAYSYIHSLIHIFILSFILSVRVSFINLFSGMVLRSLSQSLQQALAVEPSMELAIVSERQKALWNLLLGRV